MAAKTSTARKRTTARRRKPVSRARVGKGLTVPRNVPIFARLGMRVALIAAKHMDTHKDVVMSRKDAAILRMTHEGCPRCKGNGQIFTQGKDGAFTGSKPCPAKPTHGKAGRVKVAMAARFGADRNTGLIGWTCPCGTKTKPRFRDAKEATTSLRAHEKKKHGGKGVGGAWYGQAIEGTAEAAEPKKPATRKKATPMPNQKGIPTPEERTVSAPNPPYDPADPAMEHRRKPVSTDPTVRNPHSGLTDAEWVAQGHDRPLFPDECKRCMGTTFVPALNANATTDYERQIMLRCTECVAGKVSA
ncbi:hypothetical protein [Streptomyces sp. OR43]|uniref:hypothetical protein n=1 Tax=Streptomyces sp. or43 TaxID=2478957 RepID=UPI0011CE9325|nr:hypothetical protein [Streptomyces sp. or43]